MPTPAFDTAQAEGSPAVEPSPIPDKVFAANTQSDTSKSEGLALGSTMNAAGAGLDIAGTGTTAQTSISASNESASGTGAQPEQPASAPPSGGNESTAAASPAESPQTPQTSPASKEQNDQAAVAQTSVSPSPAAEVMPVKAAPSGILARGRMWLVGGLLLAALLILAWVIMPTFRRRYAFNVPSYSRTTSAAAAPALSKPKAESAPPQKKTLRGNGFVGGPRQISLQLKASKPALRHSVIPSGNLSGGLDLTKGVRTEPSRDSADQMEEPNREVSLIGSEMGSEADSFVGPVVEQTLTKGVRTEPSRDSADQMEEPNREVSLIGSEMGSEADSFVGPVIEQTAENGESLHTDTPQTPEMAEVSAINELTEVTATAPQATAETPESVEEITWPADEASDMFDGVKETASFPEEPAEIPADAEVAVPAVTTLTEFPVDSISLEPPVPDQTVSTVIPTPVLARAAMFPSDSPGAASAEPVFPQTTTPAIMPETTQTPTAPANKAPAPPMAKPQQPPAAMQTSVQLTFSFEIAAMQLTPSFKMGALKVRPLSKLVTMRLPSPHQPQSALNLQVSFEVAKIQPALGALGTIRMVPSQQQRPAPGGLPSFAVAGLQVVPNSETAPVQLIPSRQGRASVLITVPFQITTLEFAPSLEIASVILNSNSKQVAVQLPGAGPTPAEGAPMFEIASLELNEGGDIGMMHLNPVNAPKRA